MWLAFPDQVIREGEQEGNCSAFFDLDSELMIAFSVVCSLEARHSIQSTLERREFRPTSGKEESLADLWLCSKSTTPLSHAQVHVTQTDCRLGDLEGEMVEPLSTISVDPWKAGELGR